MAVLPKKYSKRGSIGVEDYILYMSERIEFYAQTTDKRLLASEKRGEELEKANKALREQCDELKRELNTLSERVDKLENIKE